MRFLNIIFAVALLHASASALYHKDVTAKTFDKLLDPSKAHILVEFYAPWCGHCKTLAPEYEKLGETFKATEDVIIAQVDADKHKKIAKRFGVEGFPTLKWIPKGSTFEQAEEPKAERSAAGLIEFVNQKTGHSKKLKGEAPPSFVTISPDVFKSSVKAEGKQAFIGFFAPWCGHCKALKPTWEELAKVYTDDKDIVIGAVDCDEHQELCAAEDVAGYPTLKYFSSGSGENYEGGRDVPDLVEFVNSKSGLDYTPDGGVTPTGGVIEEISEHVQSYMSAETEEDRTNVVNTCTDKVDELDPQALTHFMYYKKVFAKIAEKGVEYVKNERDRLRKVLDTSDSLKNAQKRSFMRRLNVLKSFDKN